MIYLDNNATTKPLPEVVEAMLPFLGDAYANPSSVHQFGQFVRHKIECAREQVARLIGASVREILFTSGGTESINTAIRGVLRLNPAKRRFLTTAVEHSAVLRVAQCLAEDGYTVDFVGVDRSGCIDPAEWEAGLTEDTALASIIHANNETGVVFDVQRLAAIAAGRGVPVHVDAVQSAGKLPINVSSLPVNFVSLSAHKFHGPKGIGAMFVRKRSRLEPLLFGGSQEHEQRGGTENVAGIIGMGAAAHAGLCDMEASAKRVGSLRDALESGILTSVPCARINGGDAPRIHNTTNVSFAGLEAEAIIILLSEAGICVSSGSACSSGSLEPSHVLAAMGIDERLAHGAIRFSLSRFNTAKEVETVVAKIPGPLARLTVLSER